VRRGVDLIGGIAKFVIKGEKILLKPNVLAGDPPEKHVTTHPIVFKAVAKLVKERTSNVYFGDSSGFGKSTTQIRKALFNPVARELGITLADLDKGREVYFQKSPFIKKFIIANDVLDFDGMISIAKMKTHALTRITGAVKNTFGVVPGKLKEDFHLKLPNPEDFSKMLITLNLLIKSRLYVMDGIVAMEGNGPRNGDPVRMNVLLFSKDPVALDSVMCKIIDLNPNFVPTMKLAKSWGLGTYIMEEIEIVGDSLEMFINKSFSVVRHPIISIAEKKSITSLVKKYLLLSRPVIDRKKCVKCGVCIHVCPVKEKAVHWKRGDKTKRPEYDYKFCIRCFCCQEFCPEGAISVKETFIGKIVR
jgi:uncharacterized protein (DUF362 family)/ferredoxin